MKHNYFLKSRGFSLIEIAIVLVIIAIIAAILTPLMNSLVTVQRATTAYDEMGRVYTAIVGNPATGNFGYLGDVGTYPTSLMDLVQSPGASGWNGPYLTEGRVDGGVLYDAFGSPLEYYQFSSTGSVTDQIAIISRGPDRDSTNTAGNPNQASVFAGTLPSNAGYGTTGANLDNVVYPRFTDNVGLLSYQNLGTLSVNIFNYDYNPSVSALVPACPLLFDVKVTSTARSADTFTMPYTPGSAAAELVQGSYKVQVRIATTPFPVVWDSTLAIVPGAVNAPTIVLPGYDSSVQPSYNLTLQNNMVTFSIQAYQFGAVLGSVITNGLTGNTATHGCGHITVRNTTTNAIVDSFLMPMGLGLSVPTAYTRYYKTAANLWPLTIDNGNVNNQPYVYVFQNDLFIGLVGRKGNKKQRIFPNIKAGDFIDVRNAAGSSLASGGFSMPGNAWEPAAY